MDSDDHSDFDPDYCSSDEDMPSEEDYARPLEKTIKKLVEDEYDHFSGKNTAESSHEQILWSECKEKQPSFHYIGTGGIHKTFDANMSPFKVFSSIIDSEVISLIVQETNRHASEKEKLNLKNSKTPSWKQTDYNEMIQYLGLNIWMELFSLQSIDHYWSPNSFYSSDIPSKIMSENRFEALLQNIYFTNNKISKEGDRFNKIQPFINLIQKKFREVYTPEENIVINESLVPSKGRLIFWPFLPAEAHYYGILLYKLCSSLGYVWSIQIYDEQDCTDDDIYVDQVERLNKVCQDLTLGLLNSGRTLYICNFFISYQMAKYFLKEKTHVVGTLRFKGTNICKEVESAKLKENEIIARKDPNGIVILKWRYELQLTTKHGPEMTKLQRRVTSSSNSSTSQKEKLKPTAVFDFERDTKSNDLRDHYSDCPVSTWKEVKWYRKLAFEIILGMGIVNAHIIYKKISSQKISLKEFKEEMVSEMLNLSM